MLDRTISHSHITSQLAKVGWESFMKLKTPTSVALNAIRKAWESGYRDAVWTRQDPDLELLRGNEEVERLYPAANAPAKAAG